MPSRPDLYGDARTIATELFERGEFEWSRRIEDAVSGGSTSTEILMRVRHCLRELLDAGVVSAIEETQARSLVTHIDHLLA
jgi:hypothetical protein